MSPRPLAALLLAASVSAAHAGYACRDLADPTGRRWFTDQPCPPGQVHDPLPVPPLVVEHPRIPDDWGLDAGSSWQVLGFDHRGRTVGMWVPAGRAVPFITTDAVRVTRGGRGRR